jgi:hypothetical protein
MTNRYTNVVFVLMLAFASLVQAGAQSKSNTPKTDALTKEADVIVVGKVGRVESAWADGKQRIETRVSVSVDETIKGAAAGNALVVVVPGGEVDGVGEWYSHTPRFGQDEDVVLFAKKDSEGKYRVAGGEHGKFTVTKDARTGAKSIKNVGTLEEMTASIKKSVKDLDSGTKHKE